MLESLLAGDRVFGHPLVLIELACGTPPPLRDKTLGELKQLQQAVVATPDASLWTLDRDLGTLAARLGVALDVERVNP